MRKELLALLVLFFSYKRMEGQSYGFPQRIEEKAASQAVAQEYIDYRSSFEAFYIEFDDPDAHDFQVGIIPGKVKRQDDRSYLSGGWRRRPIYAYVTDSMTYSFIVAFTEHFFAQPDISRTNDFFYSYSILHKKGSDSTWNSIVNDTNAKNYFGGLLDGIRNRHLDSNVLAHLRWIVK